MIGPRIIVDTTSDPGAPAARTAAIQLKKHLAWYASDFPHAARLREELFRAQEPAEVREIFWAAW